MLTPQNEEGTIKTSNDESIDLVTADKSCNKDVVQKPDDHRHFSPLRRGDSCGLYYLICRLTWIVVKLPHTVSSQLLSYSLGYYPRF